MLNRLGLDIQGIDYHYSGVSAFHLRIPAIRHRFEGALGIYGLSGSGKTTLGKILAALYGGPECRFAFEGPADKSRVLYLNQFPERNFLGAKAAETVALIQSANPSCDGLEQKVAAFLSEFSLNYRDIADKNGFEMSGGELRRFALALGFAFGPRLLILDEPTIGMGPGGRAELARIAGLYLRERDLIVISHDYEILKKICIHVWILQSGEIIFRGGFGELDKNRQIKDRTGLLDF